MGLPATLGISGRISASAINGVGTNYAFSGANNIITPFSTIMIPFTGSAHLSSNSGFDLVRVGLDYTF